MRVEGEGRKGNETPVPDWESEKVATLLRRNKNAINGTITSESSQELYILIIIN